MKLFSYIFLFLTFMFSSYSQESSREEIFRDYDLFLNTINKDTLITQKSKTYKCSDNFFGELYFYYKDEKLELIEHAYKQGFYEDGITEFYFIKDGKLILKCERKRITHHNTYSYQDKYVTKSGVEKVFELIEHRTLIGASDNELECYTRGEGKEMAASENLDFETGDCHEGLDEILDKYKLLLKAEKKFLNTFHKGPACIFHMW